MTLSINGKTYEAGELIAYVEKLEKENAELNETLGKCAKMPVLYCLGAKETITKAKEIIKNLIAIYYDPVVLESDIKLHNKIITNAEQFLNGENK